jgi:hypothetical protein
MRTRRTHTTIRAEQKIQTSKRADRKVGLQRTTERKGHLKDRPAGRPYLRPQRKDRLA